MKLGKGKPISTLGVYSIIFCTILLLGLQIIPLKATQPSYDRGNLLQDKNFAPSENIEGEQNTLAILVEFTDVKHSSPKHEIHQLIFDNMSDYWEEVSYGKITVTGESMGWYVLGRSMAYYGADSEHLIDSGDGLTDREELIRDAVILVDTDVDFKEYHHIMIVHAGVGQESNPKASDNIWSAYIHDLTIPTNDGIDITAGIIVPEGQFRGGIRAVLGVFAHEYGHSLGLPDLYSAREGNIETLGDWSLMDHGEWLGIPPGSTPTHLEAWGRIFLGWLKPTVIYPTGQEISIYPLENPQDLTRAIKIPLTDETYYIIEVRQRIGYDSYLPGEGVLVMYIDEGRKSGEGIIKLLDNEPSTIELGDAAFQVGDTFEDEENNVFVKILSINQSVYQILFAPKPIVLTQLHAPTSISINFNEQPEFRVYLTDSEGKPLPRMLIVFEYITNMNWIPLGKSVTDSAGYATLTTNLNFEAGSSTLRYVFAGGEIGDLYYLPSSTLSTLNIIKQKVILRFNAPADVSAFDETILKIYAFDEGKKPLPGVPINVLLDEELYEEGETNKQGYLKVGMKLGLSDIGLHKIKIKVPGDGLYEEYELQYTFQVHLPAFLWVLIILTPFFFLFFIIFLVYRKRPIKLAGAKRGLHMIQII